MITIEEVGPDYSPKALSLIAKLLDELRGDTEPHRDLDTRRIVEHWKANEDRFTVFIAYSDSMEALGIMTIAENFAFYADGNFGIINELYVEPAARNRQVGKMLIQTAKAYAESKGWRRLDVTAPYGDKWQRTVNFYLREGFVHAGPKLSFRP
jgi:GNAT superfamily N-acetyltransferase